MHQTPFDLKARIAILVTTYCVSLLTCGPIQLLRLWGRA